MEKREQVFFVNVSVLEGGLGEALKRWVWMGGWLPLPTRPQQYCDPASLVFLLNDIFLDFPREQVTD